MSETRKQIESRIRAENPEIIHARFGRDGQRQTVMQRGDDYEAAIAEMVEAEIERQAAEAVETERRTLRRQVVAALGDLDTYVDTLRGTGTITQAQLRAALARVCEIEAGIIRVLVGQRIVEIEDAPEGGVSEGRAR